MRLLVILLLLSVQATAQNDSPNLESFELPTIPQCWQAIDADGDDFNWEVWYDLESEGSTIQGSTGVGMMISASFDNLALALTPDNYLILPQLDVQANEHLTFQVAGLDPPYSAERYSVMVSNASDAIEDFTTTLLTDTLDSEDFEEVLVDLSDYEGEQIYVAFRHHNITNQFVMRLDDVQYPTTVEDCPIMVSVEEETPQLDVAIYPNPSNGIVTLELNSNDRTLIEIYDLSGKLVFTDVTSGSKTIDVSELEKGIYALQLSNTGASRTKQIVLQ